MNRITNRQYWPIMMTLLASQWTPTALYGASEHQTLALMFLGLVPFLLACWALSLLFAGSERRRAARNLSSLERQKLNSMAAGYGRKIVLLVAAPLGLACALAYSVQSSFLAAGAVLALGLLIGLPLMIRLSRPMRDFLDRAAAPR